jgi:glycosyltransferase involved in cell wall biosynthesis
LATITNPASKETNRFIFVGRIIRLKSIEHAIQALAEAKSAMLDIVGPEADKNYAEEMRRLVNTLGLNGRVRFWGAVSDDQKYELLKQAAAIILPSREEGQGLVLAEALVQSTLPIAAEGGAGDFITQCGAGIAYQFADVHAIAAAMRLVMHQPEATKRQASVGHSWVLEKLNPDQIAAKVQSIYESVASGQLKRNE